jgi:glucose/arabinose dehydrogenase
MNALSRRTFLAGIGALAAGCGGGSGGTAPSAAVPNGLTTAPRLYLVDTTPSLMTFPLPPIAAGNEPPSTRVFGIADTLTVPVAIARDTGGAIYVGEQTSASIKVFASGANGDAAPSRVLAGTSTQLAFGAIPALDAQNRLYAGVSSRRADGSYAGAVLRFPAGAGGDTAPDLVLSGSATTLTRITGLAVDAAGGLYVADTSGVKIFAPNASGNAAPTGVTENDVAGAVAVDPDGTLYAVGPSSSVVAYPRGTIGTGSHFASQLIISDDGRIAANVRITSIAVDATALYLVDTAPNRPYVYIVPKTATGLVSPSVIVAGIATTITAPLAVAV